MEEGTISASEPKVRKVESDKEDSDFECYNKSDGKPVHVDIDKEATEAEPALTLLPNRPQDEELNNNVEIMGGNGNISVRRSNRSLETPDRPVSVPYFWKKNFDTCRTNPKKNRRSPDWWQ